MAPLSGDNRGLSAKVAFRVTDQDRDRAEVEAAYRG